MEIAILNCCDWHPTKARRAAQAINVQIKRDVAPAWGRGPLPVRYYPKSGKPPGDAWVIHMHKTSRTKDAKKAVAEHWYSAGGRPTGVVWTELVEGEGSSVEAALSHEIVETFIDPYDNLWAVGHTRRGKPVDVHKVELCDAVAYDLYSIPVRGEPVPVANFLLPVWWMAKPPKNADFDYLGHIKAPLTKTKYGNNPDTMKVSALSDGEAEGALEHRHDGMGHTRINPIRAIAAR